MGRYAREFAAQCAEQVIWLGHEGQKADPLVNHAAGTASYPMWEQFVLPKLCRDLELDAVLCPYNTGPIRALASTRLFLVVHDLIYLESARSVPYGGSPYQIAGRIYRRFVVPAAVTRSDAIVTVSEFSGRQIEQRFHIKDKPLLVVPNTIDASWYSASPLSEPGSDFILAVSGEAPHKNLHRVLQAFRQARLHGGVSANVQLRIAGVSPSGARSVREVIDHLGLQGAAELVAYLPSAAMQDLYRTAVFMVFPSLIEGFGIPVLEAMASGCPVIASDRGAIPEVAGNAALLVDPLNVDGIERAIVRLWSDPGLRTELSARGMRNAERFHPRTIHPQMRAAWETLCLRCSQGCLQK